MATKKLKGRAIVTYGRSIISLMIAQSLGSRGVDIVGCDDVGMTVLSFSKFVSKYCLYASPLKNEEQFIEDLLAIVRENKPEEGPYVLIPAFNEAKIIARHKRRFKNLITVACPDYRTISRVDSKDRFAKTAKTLKVESPRTWLPKTQNDLKKAAKSMTFPVFIKPPNDVGGRGIRKVQNEKELKAAFSNLKKRYSRQQIIVQEGAKGVDYCFCGLFDHGKLVASMVYHNLQKFPVETGAGIVRETVDSKKFDPIVRKLMGPLKWHGVAEIDFMWDEKPRSKPSMIEVNSRFWAGLDHSINSNVDFPYLLYRLFTEGKTGEVPKAKTGYKSSLPGLTAIARLENLFATAIYFDELEAQWPKIKKNLKHLDLKNAAALFKDATRESFSFEEAFRTFKAMRREARSAQDISYGKDDAFIGLGILFILGSLIKHGELPPEITS